MAKLALSPTGHNFVQSPASAGLSTDSFASATEKQLRKAIDDAAARLRAHEEVRASWSRPGDGNCTFDEESMPDDDENTDEDKTSGEKTPGTNEVPNQQEKTDLGETRAPIKLKLFWKAPQTDDTDMNAITRGMNEHTLSVRTGVSPEQSMELVVDGFSRGDHQSCSAAEMAHLVNQTRLLTRRSKRTTMTSVTSATKTA